jgi:hypothetical protein
MATAWAKNLLVNLNETFSGPVGPVDCRFVAE